MIEDILSDEFCLDAAPNGTTIAVRQASVRRPLCCEAIYIHRALLFLSNLGSPNVELVSIRLSADVGDSLVHC